MVEVEDLNKAEKEEKEDIVTPWDVEGDGENSHK
jgi:hypothetical protein